MNETESTPPGQPGPGTLVGPYTLDDVVGTGGMATVYRAHASDGRVVAVKILHTDSVQPDDARRFSREFDTLSKLDHPNVIRVYEAGQTDVFSWIAMEFVDGDHLGAVIESWEQPPSAARMAQIEGLLRGLCEGLAYIHDKGLVHRDLKPGNVLMTHDGVPKISDFGVVKDPDAAGTALTVVGKLIGTVAFMAPEQFTNEPLDARTDLYSLGAVLFMMLTARRPIEATSVAGFLTRHLTEVPKMANHYNPAVPPALSRLCCKLLAKDPAERPLSARAVLEYLDHPADTKAPPLRSREPIIAAGLAAFRAVPGSPANVLCLVGPPGSGRTALLAQLEQLAHGLKRSTLRWSHTQPSAALDADVWLIDDAERLSAHAVLSLNQALEQRSKDGLHTTVLTAGITARGTLTALGQDLPSPPAVFALHPLDRAEVIGMMRDRGLTGPAAPVLGRRLHAAFAGLPGPIAAQIQTLIDEGWLISDDDRFRAAKPLDELRTADLPVPTETRTQISTQLSSLDADGLMLCRVLAIYDRSVQESLLGRVIDESAAQTAILRLIDRGMLVRSHDDEGPRLQFAHPSTGVVVRSRMSADTLRECAERAADTLAKRRRRADADELAALWVRAERPDRAYPFYVRAARRAAREGRFADVVDLANRASHIQKRAEHGLDSVNAIRLRRWLYLLSGEAELARGEWDLAISPLVNAVAAARLEEDTAAVARSLASLGRAYYRQGDFESAKPVLEEALRTFDPGDPIRASATRALADIRLRNSDIRGAEALWTDALDSARAMDSADAESRAIRGLAHVRALQNRLDASAALLESALDRLDRGGDPRVRCGVLSRAIELDLAAGRLGVAHHRSVRLLESVEQHELADRLADAYALRAIVFFEVGQPTEAADAAARAETYAEVNGASAWNTRLRIARVLLACGDIPGASKALPEPDKIPKNRIEDPAAQLSAIRARLLTQTDPASSKELAMWALTRPEPLLTLRGFRIKVDASRALSAVGAIEQAREGAKRAVRLLDAAGTEGFRLDALLALNQAANDPRVADACGQLARRIAERLPPGIAETFRARADLVRIGAFDTP